MSKSITYRFIAFFSLVFCFMVYLYTQSSQKVISQKDLPEETDSSKNSIFKPVVIDGPKSASNAEIFENNYKSLTNPEFLKFLRENWMNSPEKPLEQDPHDVSQHGQSTFVDNMLNQKKNGFFIECGAADGTSLSNSLFFERERNWTGILIEPNPKYFESIKKKNRQSYTINSCLSVNKASGKFHFEMKGYLSTLNSKSVKDTVIVQCFPFVSILYAVGNPKVDYFSLDVEGAEIPILKTIPWRDVHIDVIGIEYRIIGKAAETVAKLNELRQLFKSTGLYEEIGILPKKSETSQTVIDRGGLDVFFKRTH